MAYLITRIGFFYRSRATAGRRARARRLLRADRSPTVTVHRALLPGGRAGHPHDAAVGRAAGVPGPARRAADRRPAASRVRRRPRAARRRPGAPRPRSRPCWPSRARRFEAALERLRATPASRRAPTDRRRRPRRSPPTTGSRSAGCDDLGDRPGDRRPHRRLLRRPRARRARRRPREIAGAPRAPPPTRAPRSPPARMRQLHRRLRGHLPRRGLELRAQALRVALARAEQGDEPEQLHRPDGRQLPGGRHRRWAPRWCRARPARPTSIVPDPDYVLTLDADSVLLPEYCRAARAPAWSRARTPSVARGPDAVQRVPRRRRPGSSASPAPPPTSSTSSTRA